MSKTRTKSSARDRIVETAERLFYSEGVRAVGIDRIIAEAEVAKMTLYNHFGSKDELILDVLKYREQKFGEMFARWIERHEKKGLDRLEAFFAALKDWFKSSDFRGCAFINATVELADARHQATRFAAEHKHRFYDLLSEIIADSQGPKATAATPAIALLVEGAIVTAVMEQTADPADLAQDAALTLIAKAKRR